MGLAKSPLPVPISGGSVFTACVTTGAGLCSHRLFMEGRGVSKYFPKLCGPLRGGRQGEVRLVVDIDPTLYYNAATEVQGTRALPARHLVTQVALFVSGFSCRVHHIMK